MLYEKQEKTPVGVIIGRFQVHELHEAHRELIESVISRHDKVLIFLGSTPEVLVTRQNPLDFMSRSLMLNEAYPGVVVVPISDQPTNTGWSKTLDRKIKEIVGGTPATLYGSRDGFIPFYHGDYPVIELESKKEISGTKIRKAVSHDVRGSADFRHGVIYAAFGRHPVSYQTVDCVVMRLGQLLVGRKAHDIPGKYRFIGGFVDPVIDETLENAASRELFEETCGIGVHPPPFYLGSLRIDDWRYRNQEDSIMTAVFLFTYAFGDAKPGDDLDEVTWIDLDKAADVILPQHQPILQLLKAHLQGGKTNE